MSRNKYVAPQRKVTWDARATYPLWYVPAFPVKLLRYRDLEEKDPLGRDWRNALLEDIRKRGLQCPLLVLNHQMMRNGAGQAIYPDLAMIVNKPWHLRVGRNRRWALEKLGAAYAPALVTGHITSLDVEAEPIPDADALARVWTDGHIAVDREMVHVYGKCDPSRYEQPSL